MHTDPIADLLTRIRNASKAHHQSVTVPYSKIKEQIVKVIKEQGFVKDYATEKEGSFQVLKISLNEDGREINLRRVSKPGQRIYIKKEELKAVRSGLGLSVISTSKGVMSNHEARKNNIGGELLCEIY